METAAKYNVPGPALHGPGGGATQPPTIASTWEVGSMDSRIGALLAVLIPLALIQLGLMIWAIVDLVRRERVRGDSKLLWALVIVFVSTIGPIVYLVWGRQE